MEKTVNIVGHEIILTKKKPAALSKKETAEMLGAFCSYRNAKEKFDRNIIENEN